MKYIFTAISLFLTVSIVAQHTPRSAEIAYFDYMDSINRAKTLQHELDFDIYYNYNLTSSSQLLADIIYKNRLTNWVDIQAGFHCTTHSNYALLARADFKWNIKSHHTLQLRNQYLYNLFADYNSQTFNILLAAAYSQNYFYAALGASTNMIFPLMNGEKHAKVIEPVSLCYDFEGRIFPLKHHWNLALQITNITPFLVERPYSPNLILKGNVKIIESRKERIDLQFKLGFEPSGIFNIYAQQYEIYIGAGIKCKI